MRGESLSKRQNGQEEEIDMALWLFKQEPTCYSFADLRRDGRTVWDGVNNALARKHLRQIKRGDRVLFYHTGKEKAVVGVMRAVADAREAPTADDPKAVVVEVEAVKQLARPVTLAEIKNDPLLQGLGTGAAAAAVRDAGHGKPVASYRGIGRGGRHNGRRGGTVCWRTVRAIPV